MIGHRVNWLIVVLPCVCLLAGKVAAGPPPGAKLEISPEDRQKMVVCSDSKNHYVVISPNGKQSGELFYGDGKRFYQVPNAPLIGGGWFPDPRNFNKQYNESFRGLDLRHFSRVEMDAVAKTCEVACGERSAKIPMLDPKKALSLVTAATFAPSPRQWEPYALARDNSGTYYYVDRGYAPEKHKSFRLFVGQKGEMKQQKMTNVVSDSEGDIFATKTGSLKLVLNRQEYAWIEGEKAKKLTFVPWQENQQTIYNDLGIYSGERMGTPCDDF